MDNFYVLYMSLDITHKSAFNGVSTMMDVHIPHLVTVVDGGNDLSEKASGLALTQASTLADVVVQLALAGVLHHDHNLVLVLEH